MRTELNRMEDSNQKCAFLIEWISLPDDSLFAAAATKRQRLEILEQFYRKLKEPVLQELSAIPEIQVRDLPASGQAIVTAPVTLWRTLTQPGSFLDQSQTVKVLPNQPFFAIS